jgi:hypothetical protein
MIAGPFFRAYLYFHLRGGTDQKFGPASDLFTAEFADRVVLELGDTPLITPVYLTDHLSDRVLSCLLLFADGTRAIAINGRFWADPEHLLHSLVEELVHVRQVESGLDPRNYRGLPYGERPYEVEAKSEATRILGYEPKTEHVLLRRDAPDGKLYDA